MRAIYFLFLIFLASCSGNVYFTYDASNDDVYYTNKDTTTTEKTAQRDISDRADYYDPETAQYIQWRHLRSRDNDFDPFRYRYYIEDHQEGTGYKQRGCHIHEEYGHEDDYYDSGGEYDGDDDGDRRDREYETSGAKRDR